MYIEVHIMQKGIKIRLYPNKEQIKKMNSFLVVEDMYIITF